MIFQNVVAVPWNVSKYILVPVTQLFIFSVITHNWYHLLNMDGFLNIKYF